MNDYIPWAEKIRREYDAAIRLLRQRPFLATTVIVLFIFALIGWLGYSIYGLNQKEEKIKQLEQDKQQLQDELKTSKSDYERQQEIVAPVLLRAAKEFPGEEINASLKKLVDRLEQTRLGGQMLNSASATVSLRTTGTVQNGGTFFYGAYIAFGHGANALLVLKTSSYQSYSSESNVVTWSGQLTADPTSVPQDKKSAFLADSDYIQINFDTLPDNCDVLGGKIAFMFNNSATITLDIPSQRAHSKMIFIRNLNQTFKQFFE